MIRRTTQFPEAGGDKAFELLRKAMKDENKVAVAKTVMGYKGKKFGLRLFLQTTVY